MSKFRDLIKMPAHYQSLEYIFVFRMIAELSGKTDRPLRVLDYGCGHGKYLKLFSTLGCDVVGVDVNQESIAQLVADGYEVYLPSQIDSIVGEFDIVFMSHLVEHLLPEQLLLTVKGVCKKAGENSLLIVISPLLGERFFHDFSHVRPYYPQSIRHAFGLDKSLLSFETKRLLELVDIRFFCDPYRTRGWRSFYMKNGFMAAWTRFLNKAFDVAWLISGGLIGAKASWLGVYQVNSSD